MKDVIPTVNTGPVRRRFAKLLECNARSGGIAKASLGDGVDPIHVEVLIERRFGRRIYGHCVRPCVGFDIEINAGIDRAPRIVTACIAGLVDLGDDFLRFFCFPELQICVFQIVQCMLQVKQTTAPALHPLVRDARRC
jgi:hypothetical protein